MQTLFRQHFWVVQGVFVALVAWLLASMGNAVLAQAIAPVPTPQTLTARRPPRAPLAPRPTLEIDKLALLTGLPIPEPEPVVKEPTQPLFDPNAAPVRTALRLKLLGTLVAGRPEYSFASIEDLTLRDAATYMVGDEVQGASVLEITRDRVFILHEGRREYIDKDAGAAPKVATNVPVRPPVAARSAPGKAPALGSGIRATSENDYEVPRSEIDNALSNLNQLAMKARIVPAFKDGQAVGFKLFSIRPDSLYSKIGVQNGDVIKRINGFDLNSPEKALEVYTKLKEASRIDLELERGGRTVRKTYNIR